MSFAFTSGAFFSVIYIFLTKVTTDFGTPAVAALGVGHKLGVVDVGSWLLNLVP